jgi:hypothetical protein
MDDELQARYQQLRDALDAEQSRVEPDMARVDALMHELDDLQLTIKGLVQGHRGNNPSA